MHLFTEYIVSSLQIYTVKMFWNKNMNIFVEYTLCTHIERNKHGTNTTQKNKKVKVSKSFLVARGRNDRKKTRDRETN